MKTTDSSRKTQRHSIALARFLRAKGMDVRLVLPHRFGEGQIPNGVITVDGSQTDACKIVCMDEIEKYSPTVAIVKRDCVVNREANKKLEDYHVISYFNPRSQGLVTILVGEHVLHGKPLQTGRVITKEWLDSMKDYKNSSEYYHMLKQADISDTHQRK